MGAFDLATSLAVCPRCGHSQEWRLQYKYGYCRRHEYEVGDPICWFDPPGRTAPCEDHGENAGGLVRVPAFPESCCEHCSLDAGAVLWLRNNVIERVEITPTEIDGEPQQVEPPVEWIRFWSRRVAGSANEDRLELSCRGDRWTLVVADGAGGLSGGARAAQRAASALAAEGAESALEAEEWCERLRRLDREMDAEPGCGETTVVVVQVRGREVWGASAGDSGAVLVEPEGLVDLTAGQRRKPLLGSGACAPAGIARRGFSGRLLLATDGLLKYLPRDVLHRLAGAGDLRSAVDALIAAVTLPSGNLQDDLAVVLGERTG